jgi:hypothetical protein
MQRRLTALTTGLLAASILVGPLSTLVSADPGGGDSSGTIIISSTTKLQKGKVGGDVSTDAFNNDLGGGVTATSDAGMQFGSNPFGEDVKGLTSSTTNAVIDEIHTHGALVQHGDANAQNCYEGEIDWAPSITNYWLTSANSGWGPQFSGFHDCWVMATGHYYIYNSVRTDVVGPDIIRRF